MSVVIRNENFCAVEEDLAQYRFVHADTSNYSATVSAAKYPDASTDKCFGITTAAADSDSGLNGEPIQYEPLIPGYEYSVEAGEAIAIDELITYGTDGRAEDADTSTDVVVGVCTRASTAAGEIITFMCDANFSSVVA